MIEIDLEDLKTIRSMDYPLEELYEAPKSNKSNITTTINPLSEKDMKRWNKFYEVLNSFENDMGNYFKVRQVSYAEGSDDRIDDMVRQMSEALQDDAEMLSKTEGMTPIEKEEMFRGIIKNSSMEDVRGFTVEESIGVDSIDILGDNFITLCPRVVYEYFDEWYFDMDMRDIQLVWTAMDYDWYEALFYVARADRYAEVMYNDKSKMLALTIYKRERTKNFKVN